MKAIYFFAICFILLCTNNFAQLNTTRLDSLLHNGSNNNFFSGVIVISKNGKAIYEKKVGLADFQNKRDFTKKSQFQIASVSKQFTAYGIMLLAKQGKLVYTDLVRKYINNFPYNNITILHLLQHTSGLPNFWDSIRPYLSQSISNGNKELLDFLRDKKLPLQYEPGSQWQYADIGYDILANIIEKCSGLSYQKFLQKYIFKPTGMKSTAALMVTDIRKINNKNISYGHTWDSATQTLVYSHLLPKNDFVYYLGNIYGDGSVISTAKDLQQWANVLLQYQLLDSASFAVALQPVRDNKDSIIIVNKSNKMKPSYGFGWGLATHPKLGKFMYHSGGHPGFVSYYFINPKNKLVIIFLSNINSSSNLSDMRIQIMEIIYDTIDTL